MRVKSCLLLERLGDERWRVAYARCKISEPVDVVSIAGRVACADNLVGLWDMPRAQIRLASWRARIPCHRWASATSREALRHLWVRPNPNRRPTYILMEPSREPLCLAVTAGATSRVARAEAAVGPTNAFWPSRLTCWQPRIPIYLALTVAVPRPMGEDGGGLIPPWAGASARLLQPPLVENGAHSLSRTRPRTPILVPSSTY